MATYRVVLEIEVEDEDISRSRSEDALKDLIEGADGDEYLGFYVKDEMTWLHSSFGNVEVRSVKRLDGKKVSQNGKVSANG